MSGLGAIKRTKITQIGDWDLTSLDITDWDIPVSRVNGVKTGVNSSAGVLKKFNIPNFQKTKLLYVKSGSSSGNYNSVLEPITEKICSMIGRRIGFDNVRYGLWTIDSELLESKYRGSGKYREGMSLNRTLYINNRTLVSICESFLTESENFYSCDKLFNEVDRRDLYHTLCEYGNEEMKKKLDQMRLFDYIVHNTDRHRKNFGFIKNQDSNEVRMAPLFDHGLALLSDIRTEEIIEDGMEVLTYAMQKPFGSLHDWNNGLSSFEGLDIDVDSDELVSYVDMYSKVIGEPRSDIMKRTIESRWNYAKKILS